MRTQLTLCIALAALSASPDPAVAASDSPDGQRIYTADARRDRGRAAPPPHAAAYGQRYSRGDRLPPVYRHHNYVVDNWRVHRLHAPPPGHHWVSIGADYLLVAIATGIIVDVLVSQAAAAQAPSAGASLPPPAAGVFYYFCDSANAYYPYVSRCPEGWRVLPTTPPGPVR